MGDQLTAHTEAAVKFALDNPTTVESNAVIVGAWNENDEGHWIVPSLYNGTQKLEAIQKGVRRARAKHAQREHDGKPTPTCASTNTTYLSLTNVCIHSDHTGLCGTIGGDSMNLGLKTAAECSQLCCANRGICAGFLFYEAYKTATDNCTAGGSCCWLKSTIAPAERWSNDP